MKQIYIRLPLNNKIKIYPYGYEPKESQTILFYKKNKKKFGTVHEYKFPYMSGLLIWHVLYYLLFRIAQMMTFISAKEKKIPSGLV